eukprot:jgi/Ulvmu1/12504/UM009_0159.1
MKQAVSRPWASWPLGSASPFGLRQMCMLCAGLLAYLGTAAADAGPPNPTECGGARQACCTGQASDAACNEGVFMTACISGTCEYCGVFGSPCCEDDYCMFDLYACLDGVCDVNPSVDIFPQCGEYGQECCDGYGDPCDRSSLACISNICQRCGQLRQACCPGDICEGVLDCVNSVCSPPGGDPDDTGAPLQPQ